MDNPNLPSEQNDATERKFADPSPSILSLIEQRHDLRKALNVALGYMTNAAIDLETGAPKRTAINTINGGIDQVRAALAANDAKASGAA